MIFESSPFPCSVPRAFRVALALYLRLGQSDMTGILAILIKVEV